VVQGDYKELIKPVKREEAIVSNEYELNEYKARLSIAHRKALKPKSKPPGPKNYKPQKPVKEEEECLPCKEKAKKSKQSKSK
jgi:hypothetical protein